VRVVVADDSVLFREGLVRVLKESGFDVLAQAGDADELLAAVAANEPDVAVVDIRMPPSHTNEGLVAAERIRRDHPSTSVLVLSQYVEPAHAVKLLSSADGSVGYLLKDRVGDLEEFAEAVRRVSRGQPVIDPAVVAQLLEHQRSNNPIDRLSEREREVLGLMAEGRSNQAIREVLFLSQKTVETHVRSIFAKLDLPEAADDHRRVLAVLTYLRS
jgi:DNA-binding NarL/FixJ family response regulator